MQAVLLAAGQSSRFYPFNSLGHKSLVELGGKTLLLRTIQHLKKAGVTNIIIIESLNEAPSRSLTEEDTVGVSVKFIIQGKATGMGDALLCAAKYLEASFFVLHAYHFELPEFIKEMVSAQKEKTDVVLLTQKTDDASGSGAVVYENGKATIVEKGIKGEADKVVGIYLLNHEFVSLLHTEKKDHYNFESALSSYSNDHTLVLVQTKKSTLTLKYPWDLLTLKDYLLGGLKRKIAKSADVSAQAVIKGDVVIEDGAVIKEGAVITGPAYIGRGAYVGTNSVLRGGVMVEEKAVVGALIEIKNSILMRGATTHNGFIGDSIIGEKTKIAAGFNSANVRLDRKNVATVVKGERTDTKLRNLGIIIGSNSGIGLKVGTMPGIIIGNNVAIGPGTTVMENVESDTVYYTEVKGIVKKSR